MFCEMGVIDNFAPSIGKCTVGMRPYVTSGSVSSAPYLAGDLP